MATFENKENEKNMDKIDACIVIPPFIKYSAGPLLGPSILKGASKKYGYETVILDLNIEYIHLHIGDLFAPAEEPIFYGDHSKISFLNSIENIFWKEISKGFPEKINIEELKNAWYSHELLYNAVDILLNSELAEFFEQKLKKCKSTHLFGFSLMWSGQILPAMLISAMIKKSKMGAKVLWGGPHFTAIIDHIIKDEKFGKYVDGFLAGHSEGSFIKLIESLKWGRFDAPGLVIAGKAPSKMPESIIPPPEPVFDDLHLYGIPKLMIPFQTSKGCPYAKCAFCTYPAIEGKYEKYPLDGLENMVRLAQENDAGLAFKDSLIPAPLLREIAKIILGRVEWSASTKLSPNLNSQLLSYIAQNGCRTLEVGLESVDPVAQEKINKVQPLSLLDEFLKAAEKFGISVVINYITDFPWENTEESKRLMEWTKVHLKNFPRLKAKIEHNTFNLETLSHMAKNPEKFGISIDRTWPWSSILEWKLTDTDKKKIAKGANKKVYNIDFKFIEEVSEK